MKENIIRAVLYQDLSVKWKNAELNDNVNVHLNAHQKARQFVEVELGDFLLNKSEGEALLISFERNVDGEIYHVNPTLMESVDNVYRVFRLQIPTLVHITPGIWGAQIIIAEGYNFATGEYVAAYPADQIYFLEGSSFLDDGLEIPSKENLSALYNEAKEALALQQNNTENIETLQSSVETIETDISRLNYALNDFETGTGVAIAMINEDILKLGARLEVDYNQLTHVVHFALLNKNGAILSVHSIDFPLESVVVGGKYDDATKSVVLTLQSGETVSFPIGDLVDGLISSSEKGAVNGVASLDGNGKVPREQLPDDIGNGGGSSVDLSSALTKDEDGRYYLGESEKIVSYMDAATGRYTTMSTEGFAAYTAGSASGATYQWNGIIYSVYSGSDFIFFQFPTDKTGNQTFAMLSDVDTVLEAAKAYTDEEIAEFDFIKIVSALPETGLPNRIYLVPQGDGENTDFFVEYLWVNKGTDEEPVWVWEYVGKKTVEIDLTEYVKKDQYATADEAGLVKFTGSGNGIHISSTDGSIKLAVPTDTDLSLKIANKALLVSQLDKVIRLGLTTNSETLTDEEKAAAKTWLGISASSGGEVAYAEGPANSSNADKYVDGIISIILGGAGGIAISTNGNGKIVVVKAQYSTIDKRSASDYLDGATASANHCRPITPAVLDYAVMKALSDCKIEWTEDQKAAARSLLGVGSYYHYRDGEITDGDITEDGVYVRVGFFSSLSTPFTISSFVSHVISGMGVNALQFQFIEDGSPTEARYYVSYVKFYGDYEFYMGYLTKDGVKEVRVNLNPTDEDGETACEIISEQEMYN